MRDGGLILVRVDYQTGGRDPGGLQQLQLQRPPVEARLEDPMDADLGERMTEQDSVKSLSEILHIIMLPTLHDRFVSHAPSMPPTHLDLLSRHELLADTF